MNKENAEKIQADLEKIGYEVFIQSIADFLHVRRLRSRPSDLFDYVVVVLRGPKVE